MNKEKLKFLIKETVNEVLLDNDLVQLNESNHFSGKGRKYNWLISVSLDSGRNYGEYGKAPIYSYFKIYNSDNLRKSTKENRIYFYIPEYVKPNHGSDSRIWVLNNQEKNELIDILNSSSPLKHYNSMTVWQAMMSNMAENLGDKYVVNINTPIPDYTQLKW